MSQVHHSVVSKATCCGFSPSLLLDDFSLKEFSHPLNTWTEKSNGYNYQFLFKQQYSLVLSILHTKPALLVQTLFIVTGMVTYQLQDWMRWGFAIISIPNFQYDTEYYIVYMFMLIGNEEQTCEICNCMYTLFMLFTKWGCEATTDRCQSLRHKKSSSRYINDLW